MGSAQLDPSEVQQINSVVIHEMHSGMAIRLDEYLRCSLFVVCPVPAVAFSEGTFSVPRATASKRRSVSGETSIHQPTTTLSTEPLGEKRPN